MSMNHRFQQLLAAAIAALLCCALGTGCVQRRMIVRSNPPGAVVFVDNQEIGTTPCATDFIYYGTREITIKKEGFETLTVKQPIPTPWYQYVPLDFVTENLVPGQIRDTRLLEYTLQPTQAVNPQELVGRADTLRRGTHAGPVTPAIFAPTAPQPLLPTAPTPLFPGQFSPGAAAPGSLQPGYVPQPGYLPPPGNYPQLQPAPEPIAPGQTLGR